MSDVFAEHRALVESGRFADAMRLSGEHLAAAEAALNASAAASAQEKARCAVEFMNAGSIHLADLHYAEMLSEEAATALMMAATVIVARVNPESIPDAYVHWLQSAVMRFGDALQQSPDERLTDDFARELKLTVVTADEFGARFSLDADILRTNEALKNYLEVSGMADATYGGEAIVPRLALDILVNAINTMASIGWCGMDN